MLNEEQMNSLDVSINKVIESLNRSLSKQKNKETWIIKYNGQQVKLNSNKQVWSSIGHAKNALCYEFYNLVHEGRNHAERKDIRDYIYSKFEFVRLA